MPRDFSIIAAGALRSNIKLSITDRIGHLHDSVVSLIDEFEPQFCVIEKAFCGNNVNSALRLGEVRGAMIASVRRFGLEVIEITPAEVKKTIAGNGRASKEEVKLAVQTLMKITDQKVPFDVTDAIAIALTFGMSIPHWLQRNGITR